MPPRAALLQALLVGVCLPVSPSAFEVLPNESSFGATITGLDVSRLLEGVSPDFDRATIPKHVADVATSVKRALHEHRYLHFPLQDGLTWETQLAFLQLFGDAYDESSHVNRKSWKGEKDARVAVFSNNPEHGLVGVGVEGFHSDGNVVPIPHAATLLYCESTIAGGNTLLVPLNEVHAKLDPALIDGVNFASAHVPGLEHPLAYHHPSSGRQTLFFGLGALSGLYSRHNVTMTQEETDAVTGAIESAIDEVGVCVREREERPLPTPLNPLSPGTLTSGTPARS
jgi:hypothetical protein